MLVISEKGEQLGVLPIADALSRAQSVGLDLVEVASDAVPPVCKIMDYGKRKYEQQKRKQEAKKRQVVVQVKEIRLRPKIDEHDYQTKVRHIVRFIEGGAKCRVSVLFRGREIVHKERAELLLRRVIEDTRDVAKVEQEPKMEGRVLDILLSPLLKKENK